MTEKPHSTREDASFDFSSVHSEGLPRLLAGLNIALAVTSYQAGRLIFLRSDGERLDTQFKAFPRPMGVAADRSRLTLGTWNKLLEFRRNDDLLRELQSGAWEDHGRLARKIVDEDEQDWESQRRREFEAYQRADTLFVPRASHVTGMINIHDIAWGDEGLWAVNSTFSCLCTFGPDHSFVPRWKPPFISELAPEDRCHLNGMALEGGRPKYVTTFNKLDVRDAWRNTAEHDGTLIDVETGRTLLDGLVMPHSPRCYRGAVYLCESGTGRLLRYDPGTGRAAVVKELPGFPRGMAFHGPLLFVGLSKVRASEVRNPIPLARKLDRTLSGVWVLNLATLEEIGYVSFEGDVDQIYDIAVIEGAAWPELIEFDHPRARHLFDFPRLEPANEVQRTLS